jgi:hypothetical protein
VEADLALGGNGSTPCFHSTRLEFATAVRDIVLNASGGAGSGGASVPAEPCPHPDSFPFIPCLPDARAAPHRLQSATAGVERRRVIPFSSFSWVERGARTNGERASGRILPDVFTMSNSDPCRGGEIHVGTKFLEDKIRPRRVNHLPHAASTADFFTKPVTAFREPS